MLFSLLLLAIGVYVLFSGIRGSGKLFAVENLKEEYKEKYPKAMRAFFIPIGALMVINGIASVGKSLLYTAQTNETTGEITYVLNEGIELGSFSFLTTQVFDIINYVCMGLVIVGVVGWLFVTRKMTDRNAPAASASGADAQQRAERQAGHILPVSAFEFDEDESDESSDEDDQQD